MVDIGRLRHARRPARMKEGRNPVLPGLGERQRLCGLAGKFGSKAFDRGIVLHGVFRADEGHDPAFRRRQIPVQVNFQNGPDAGGMPDRFGDLLCDVSLGKGAQRDHHLCPGFAQDCADLLWLQQRVDRVDDPRRHRPQKDDGRFDRIGQNEGHDIGFPDAKAAKQVCRLSALSQKLCPGQRFRRVRRA